MRHCDTCGRSAPDDDVLSCSRHTGQCIANYRVCGRPVDGSDCGCAICVGAENAALLDGPPPAPLFDVDAADALRGLEPAELVELEVRARGGARIVVVDAPRPWYESEEPRAPAWRRSPKWHPVRPVGKC